MPHGIRIRFAGINSNSWCRPEYQRENYECFVCLEKANYACMCRTCKKASCCLRCYHKIQDKRCPLCRGGNEGRQPQ
uniref:RING-type domain-containing protein n=1 Tax=Magallana gigas TaxID=29159 RepID=A0A8W8MFH8_MAGGI